MIGLIAIKETVIQVAEAITAALEIETEIVDSNLQIIGGTGRYQKKIGTYEEDGDLESGYLYGCLLKSGVTYVNDNVSNDRRYDSKEGELGEVCCPIMYDSKVIGIIGLVAFDSVQLEKIKHNSEQLLMFLKRMAYLMSSKLEETRKNQELNAVFESIHDGLLIIGNDYDILSCNHKSEELLELSKKAIIGKRIDTIFSSGDILSAIDSAQFIRDKEDVFADSQYQEKRFLLTIVPSEEVLDNKETLIKCVVIFQDFSDLGKRMYEINPDHHNDFFNNIVGNSQEIGVVKKRALQVASSDSTVLINGESGTGKELFARAIHNASTRSGHAFISINCGAIPDMLLESELFGYEKGAFTGADRRGKPGKFELANKGTIFLDEIGDLPLHLQVKLLHVIQNRTMERVGGVQEISINVRIIAATNKNLEHMIEVGEFREDLYFRLNVIPLDIPPLRERAGDIEILLSYALEKFSQLLNKPIKGFTKKSLEALLAYPWPGNVRELENVVEYAVNMETHNAIEYSNLPIKLQEYRMENHRRLTTLKETIDHCQKKAIETCLQNTGHTLDGKRLAAKILDISESTLYRRIRELGISEK